MMGLVGDVSLVSRWAHPELVQRRFVCCEAWLCVAGDGEFLPYLRSAVS